MSGTRAIDLLITYRIIKLLTTPFEKQDAYRLGIIDKNEKVLRKTKELKTGKERDAYTILHRFVFNLKRLINLVPGGKSKLGTYAAALGLLLKENKDINEIEIEKVLYKHLSDNDLLVLDDDIKESTGFDYLPEGRYIITDRLTDTLGKQSTHIQELWTEIGLKNERITKLTNKIYELQDVIKSQRTKDFAEFWNPERVDN